MTKRWSAARWPPCGVEDGTASAVGTANFTDVDLTDDHVVSSALESTDDTRPMGTFTAVETADTIGSGSGGVVSWSYAINNAAASSWPMARW